MPTHIKIGTRIALVAGLLTVASGEVARAQSPPNRYAVLTITNKTPNTVRYLFHWGETDKWYRIELKPGAYHWHSWTYPVPNQHHSPHFHIRFDSFLGSAMSMRNYRLDKAASPSQDPDRGLRYDFKVTADGHSIDLYKMASRSLNN